MAKIEQFEAMLVDYLDGALDDASTAEVKKQLAKDPELAADLRQIEKTMELLGDLPRMEPPHDLLKKINSGIEAAEASMTDQVDEILERNSTKTGEINGELGDLSKTVKLLKDLPKMEPPPDLLKGIMAKTISANNYWQRIFKFLTPKREAPWPAIAAGLAACTLLIVLLTVPMTSFKSFTQQDEVPISMETTKVDGKLKAKPKVVAFKEKSKEGKFAYNEENIKTDLPRKEAIASGPAGSEAEGKISTDKTTLPLEAKEDAGKLGGGDIDAISTGAKDGARDSLRAKDRGISSDGFGAANGRASIGLAKEAKTIKTKTTSQAGLSEDKSGENLGGGRSESGNDRSLLPDAAPPPAIVDSVTVDDEEKFETAVGGVVGGTGKSGGGTILKTLPPTDNLADESEADDHDAVLEERAAPPSPDYRRNNRAKVTRESGAARAAKVASPFADNNMESVINLLIQNRFEGVFSGIKTRKMIKVHSNGEFISLWKSMHSNMTPAPSPPKVNFNNSFVVAVFIGTKYSSGYNVRITRVELKEGKILVHGYSTKPSGENSMLTVLTQPYSMVIVNIPEGKTITTDTPVVFLVK